MSIRYYPQHAYSREPRHRFPPKNTKEFLKLRAQAFKQDGFPGLWKTAREYWEELLKATSYSKSPSVINDAMPIWLLPKIGQSCLSRETTKELNIQWKDCSGRYLGKDDEGNDRWSAPVLIKSKLVPDKRNSTNSNNPYNFDTSYINLPYASSTCELPVYTGGERKKSKIFWTVPSTGERVPACTRGCQYSFREGKCFHGVLIAEDGLCTTNCEQCRKPHRSRTRKGGYSGTGAPSQYDAKITIAYCRSPYQELCEDYPGLNGQWETTLRSEPWSGEYFDSDGNPKGRNQMPILLLAKELGRGMVGRKLVDFDSSNIPTQGFSNKEQKERDAQQLDRYGVSINDVQRAEVIPEHVREVPFWCQNNTFIEGLLKFIYPADTQRKKIEFSKQLIHLYWVLSNPVEEVLKELNLTKGGLMCRIQRLNAKALEYNNITNTFAHPEPTVSACGEWKEVNV